MRKTLAGLGALAVAGLTLVYCDSQQTGSTLIPLDMTVPTADLTTIPDPDLATPADMVTVVPTPPTEFSVVRIGTGVAALTNDATAAFIERRKIADGSLSGAALALPTAVNGANKQLTMSGLATVEGQLSRSADGKYLLVAGYAANPGIANISTSASATYNRVVGRIDAIGTINTATATSSYTGAAVRGVTSTDGTALWVSTDSGIGYTTLNSTAAPTVMNILISRAIDIFGTGNGRQLYVSSASASGTSTLGINAVGTGTPNAAATPVARLTGFTDANSPADSGFVGLDRDGNGAIDQLYVADDRAPGGGVQRWRLVGTSWTLDGTITTGANSGARFVTAFVSGNTATVLVTSAETTANAPRILQLTDAGGTIAAITSKLLATAAANTTYRGIALAPIP